MLKTAGKLAPEAKPRVANLLFQAFFVYSRVAYTIFPHTFSEKWHLCQDHREGMCHFRLGYEEKSIFEFRHFPCLYIIYIKKRVVSRKCMCVCVRACVRKFSILCRSLTPKRLPPIALKLCLVICICFLKNPIDFGDDLPKIVVFRLYWRFCLIWEKFVYTEKKTPGLSGSK